MTNEPLKPSKAIGDYFKLLLKSTDATTMPDNSFRFNVDMSAVEGEDVRVAVKRVVYPAPATYIPRRMWFSSGGNTWITSYTTSLDATRINNYNELYAKYGQTNYMYFFVPITNTFARLKWNSGLNSQIRGTAFSSSVDGVNWTADGSSAANGVPGSSNASVYVDIYEIDITATPVGTNIQNIHIGKLNAWRSWDTNKQNITDIIGNVVKMNFNPYAFNDAQYEFKDYDCANEVSAIQLKNTSTLNVYFSRVDTPSVKELVALPWSLELVIFVD